MSQTQKSCMNDYVVHLSWQSCCYSLIFNNIAKLTSVNLSWLHEIWLKGCLSHNLDYVYLAEILSHVFCYDHPTMSIQESNFCTLIHKLSSGFRWSRNWPHTWTSRQVNVCNTSQKKWWHSRDQNLLITNSPLETFYLLTIRCPAFCCKDISTIATFSEVQGLLLYASYESVEGIDHTEVRC